MKIIKLDESHISQIYRIESECFAHPWSEQSILDAMRAGHTFFGFLQDGILRGFAGVNIICGEGYIDNVAVSEKYRSCGIGRAIMNAVISHCKSEDVKSISLEVRCSNKSAIALYESLGFRSLGIRPKFYTAPIEDANIFELITNN